jgi:hypothetical protein
MESQSWRRWRERKRLLLLYSQTAPPLRHFNDHTWKREFVHTLCRTIMCGTESALTEINIAQRTMVCASWVGRWCIQTQSTTLCWMLADSIASCICSVRVFCKTQLGANVYRAAIGSATTFVHVVTTKNYIRPKLYANADHTLNDTFYAAWVSRSCVPSANAVVKLNPQLATPLSPRVLLQFRHVPYTEQA